MKTEVATCDGHADTEQIMNTMTEGRFRHMPVVADGALAGIISIGDVVKVRIAELATEKRATRRLHPRRSLNPPPTV